MSNYNRPAAPSAPTASKKVRTLDEAGEHAHVAEIVYHEGQIMLPNGMGIEDAIGVLHQRAEYLQQVVTIQEMFDVFPWDGAAAIDTVLTKKFGFSPSVATPGFFGPTPPRQISVDVGVGQVRQVPWGSFSLPGVTGLMETGMSMKNGRRVFALSANVQRKDEATIREIFEMTRHELRTNSIYRGKAIKLRFRDDHGNLLEMPEPRFMDVSKISQDMVIYSDEVNDQIKTNLFTPILRVQDCLANDIPVKRGVLLGGTYGTGKTLAATVASRLCVDVGITYVYTPRADELADAIEFAKQYQSPATMVFCEDIDREMDGERSVAMDDILNIIDGIDTKTSNIIVVLTTNSLDSINPAMLRPGRLDAVINVTPPDAKAVEKLLRFYGKAAIASDTVLTHVGIALEGQIPAVIAEVVKRAKLSQLALQDPGTLVTNLSADALLLSAKSMAGQLELLAKRTEEVNRVEPPELSVAMANVMAASLNGAKENIAMTRNKVDKIGKAVGIN